MYIILIIYAIDGFTDVVTNQTKSISKSYSKIDLGQYDGFAPGEAKMEGGKGFNMAFGLKSKAELPREIGTWSVNYI